MSDIDGAGIPSDPPTPSANIVLRFDRRQQTLHGVLKDKNDAAASIYVGALLVLADKSNPDRLALAAHGIRELINLIPQYFELPMEQKDDTLGNKVDALHVAWDAEQKRTKQPNEAVTEKFRKKLQTFFDWHTRHHPKQKEFAAAVLTHLDPTRRSLPGPIRDLRVEEWRSTRDYFVRAAHHGGCVETELLAWLEALETFLLNLVKPRFFEKADELDALIAEGEDG